MTINVLIGVGGTGAKVVESALHLFLAGLGPGKVIVGLVDQDNANGNVARTKALINDLVRFRADWSTGANRLDWGTSDNDGGCALGRVEIERLFGADCHWRPEQAGDATLARVLQRDQMSPDERVLLDMLFAPGPEEQEMPLVQGYCGRAHIGSAAMLASLDQDVGGFNQRITELIAMANQGQDIRIFLVGSVFGGTGAAGFPTLARAVNQIRRGSDPEGVKTQVRVGGALMLPYFGFLDSPDPDANVVKASELMPQARAALEYYERLFETERVFERLYVVGWDQFFQLGYHEPGKEEQKNPPLAPELLAAGAALEFFAAPAEPAGEKAPVLVSARAGRGALSWPDMPFDAPEKRDEAYKRLGQLLRFALYWRLRVDPELDKRQWGRPKAHWLRDYAKLFDSRVETPEDRLRLDELLDKTLKWAAAMKLFTAESPTEALAFELWDTRPLLRDSDRTKPADPVGFHPAMDSPGLSRAFDTLINVFGRTSEWRGAGQLFEEINQPMPRQPRDRNAGLGRLVCAVHHAARPL